MARYEITAPDGSRYEITAPDNASEAQVMEYAQSQWSEKPKAPSQEELRARYQQEQLSEMSGPQRFFAGAGAGLTNIGQGLGQMVGLTSRADVEETRRLQKPLVESGAGMAGNITGTVAGFAPTAFIPGANTLTGAALLGAGTGLVAPSTSTTETATNALAGGVLGPAALLAARAVPAALQGAKGLIEPFYGKGQQQIASRALTRFAGSPQAARQAAQRAAAATPEIPGVRNTLGEVADNAGLAQLERALRQNPEVATQFTEQLSGNRAAMLSALQGVAGDDAALAAARQTRGDAADVLYGQARSVDQMRRSLIDADNRVLQGQRSSVFNAPPAQTLTTEGMEALKQRPSMKTAAALAQRLASEKGTPMKDPFSSVNGLHYVKLALDDMIEKASSPTSKQGKNTKGALIETKKALLKEIEDISPMYRSGREVYEQMSQPINQMEIGRELVNRFQPALADFGADTRTTAAIYAKALRDADALAQDVTGSSAAKMADILTPEQMKTATGVAKELAKRAKADELGRIPGSNTAQNLVSQNLMRQILGPLGLPESIGESTLTQSLLRVPQFAASLGEKRVLTTLAEAMQDPAMAIRLMQMTEQQSIPMRGLLAVEPYIAPGALGMYGAQ